MIIAFDSNLCGIWASRLVKSEVSDLSEANSALELPAPVSVVPGREMPAEVSDEREYSANITEETPRDMRAEEAFIASKQHLAMTHPILDFAEREEALAELTERIERARLDAMAKEGPPPSPGGTGYGVYYNVSFKMAFATGTTLYWKILCPTSPGGNVEDCLYLSTMRYRTVLRMPIGSGDIIPSLATQTTVGSPESAEPNWQGGIVGGTQPMI
jgi:hypothetical protein